MKEYQILLYTINGQYFGTDAEEVDEIRDLESLESNESTPVSYLGVYLGLEEPTDSTSNRKIILTSKNGEHKGFIVDDVIQLLKVTTSSIHNAPEILLTQYNKFIDKFCIANEQLFPVINLSKINL